MAQKRGKGAAKKAGAKKLKVKKQPLKDLDPKSDKVKGGRPIIIKPTIIIPS